MKRCQGCGKETNLVTGLGPVLLCRDECYPDANIARESAQSNGESFDITIWTRKRIAATKARARIDRRNNELEAKAQSLGFNGLSSFLTAWKNDEIEITVKHTSR